MLPEQQGTHSWFSVTTACAPGVLEADGSLRLTCLTKRRLAPRVRGAQAWPDL
jgi:hypothetical protein